MICLDKDNKEIQQWVNAVGEYETYRQFILHNYYLPKYKDFFTANSYKGLSKVERDNLINSYLDLSNYSVEAVDKIKNMAPDSQAAFFRKTFYFAEYSNKLQVNEEAFHAIFQTLLSSEEKDKLYSVASDVLNRRLKLNNLSKNELYTRVGKYSKLKDSQLNKYILEEELAKLWTNWATYGESLINQKSFADLWKDKDLSVISKVIETLKILFDKLKALVSNYNSNYEYLESVFSSVKNGDFLGKSPISENDISYPSLSSIVLRHKDAQDDFILNPIEQNLHYNKILSIANQLYDYRVIKADGNLYSSEDLIADALEIYKDEVLSTFSEGSTESILRDDLSEKTSKLDNKVRFRTKIYKTFLKDLMHELNKNKRALEDLEDLDDDSEDFFGKFLEDDSEKSNKVDRYTSLPARVKQIIAATEIIMEEDAPVSVTRVVKNATGTLTTATFEVTPRRLVDPYRVYSAIVRATTNTLGEFDRLRKLILFTLDVETNTDTTAFINYFLKRIYKTKDGDRLEFDFQLEELKTEIINNKFDKYELSDTDYYAQIMKAFDFWTRHNMTMKVSDTGESIFYDPNFTNVRAGQMDQWQTNWELKKSTLTKPYLATVKSLVLQDVLFSKTTDAEAERAASDMELAISKMNTYLKKVPLEIALNRSEAALSNLFDFYGIKVSNTFKKYIVAEKYSSLNVDLKPVTVYHDIYNGFQMERNEFNLNLWNLSQGLNKIDLDTLEDTDPYNTDNSEDVISSLRVVAYGNSFFDETVLASTFLNAEKERIYAHQLQTFILKFGNYTMRKKDRLKKHAEDLLKISKWNDNSLSNNPLWDFYYNELTDKERTRLDLFSYSGVALHEADDEGNFKKEIKAVVNDLNPFDFIAYQANAIINESFLSKEGKWNSALNSFIEEPVVTVPYYLGSNETSNTQTFFTGRWYQGFKDSEGNWSPLVKGVHSVGNGAVNLAKTILDGQVNRAIKFRDEFMDMFAPSLNALLEPRITELNRLKKEKETVADEQKAAYDEIIKKESNYKIIINQDSWRSLGFTGPGIIEGFHTGTLMFKLVDDAFVLDTDYLADSETKAPRGLLIHLNLNGFIDESGRDIIYNYLYKGLSEAEYEKQIKTSITKGLNNTLSTFYNQLNLDDTKQKNLISSSFKGNIEGNKKDLKIKRLGFFNSQKDGSTLSEAMRNKMNFDMFFLNSMFNREMYQRILHGDPGVINKYDHLDPVKRNKGEDAQVVSVYTELENTNFGVGAFTSMKGVQYNEADQENVYGKDISGVTNKAINSNDAQTLTSAKHRLHYLHGLRKLNKHNVRLFDKMISGHKMSRSEVADLLENKTFINIEKSRLFDQQNDIKTSEALLYKLFTAEQKEIDKNSVNVFDHIKVIYTLNNTSYRVLPQEKATKELTVTFDLNKYKSFEAAYAADDYKVYEFIPISKDLNDKRRLLEGWRLINDTWTYSEDQEINFMSPISAHKRLKQDVWNEDVTKIQAYHVHEYSTIDYGRQVENPGKTKVTDPTQQIEILPSNLPNSFTLYDEETKQRIEVNSANIISEYFKLLAARDIESVNLAVNLIYDSVKDEISYSDLYSVIRDSLIDTGGDIQMIELFMTDNKGKAVYNGNLPMIKVKLQQHLFSYLSKDVFVHKVPGDAFAMQSPRGMMFLKKLTKETVNNKTIYSWESVSRSDKNYANNLTNAHQIPVGLTYNGYTLVNDGFESYNTLNSHLETLWSDDTPVYFLDELRHLKPRIVNGVVENHYSEAVIPQRDAKQYKPFNDWKYVQGVRIPSQDRATSANIEIIDFMDAVLGNSVSVAKEVQELAGSDFDIDKLYIQFFEGKYEDNTFKLYENTFEDYLDYIFTKNKLLKKKLKEAVENDKIVKGLNKEITEVTELLKEFDSIPGGNVNIEQWQEARKANKNALRDKRTDLFTKKFKELSERIKPEILKEYKLPSTEQEFNFTYGELPFKGVVNNRLLTLKKNLLLVDYNFYKNPTDVSYVKNVAKNDPLGLKMNKNFDSVAFMPLNSPMYDLYYKLRAVAGKIGIGSTVTSNLTWLLLERAGVYLNEDFHINLQVDNEDVITYQRFERDVVQIKEEAIRAVSQNNSEIISASTDEAKEGILAKYNMVGELLSVFTEGQTIGIHPEVLIAVINNIQIQNLAALSLRNPLRLEKVYSLKDLVKEALGDYEWKTSVLNLGDLSDLTTTNSKDILSFVYKLLSLKDQNKDLAQLIKLKRGFGATYEDYKRLLLAMTRLGINSDILSELDPETGQLTKIFNEAQHSVYDLDLTKPGFEQIKAQLEQALPVVDMLTKKIFIEATPNYKLLNKKIKNIVKPLEFRSDDFDNAFNDALLGSLIANADPKLKEQLSIDLLIGENSVASNLLKILKERPELREHPLFKKVVANLGFDKQIKRLKKLSKNKNKSIEALSEEALKTLSVDNVRLNLFSKLSPELQTSLMDDVMYFLSFSGTEDAYLTDFVRSLYNYFIVKDGMRYSPIGLSKIFPTAMFKGVSKLYDEFIANSLDKDAVIKLRTDLEYRIARDINNLDLWTEFKYEDADETIIEHAEYPTRRTSNVSPSVKAVNVKDSESVPTPKYFKNDGAIYYRLGSEEKQNQGINFTRYYYAKLPMQGIEGYKASIANTNIATSTVEYKAVLDGYNSAVKRVANPAIQERIKSFIALSENMIIFEAGKLQNFKDSLAILPELSDEFTVDEQKQIHILGGKQDIEGFKKFVEQPINKEIKPNENLTPKANIPQNLVSGKEAFGTKQEANAEAKKALGANPHSIDMVEAGFRTRTTRSVGEMEKYNVKVGDIVKQFGKSAGGTTKNILTRIIAIHPKGTPGFLGTWNKEGWTQDGIKAIERFKDGAAAIEFEVVNQPTEIKPKIEVVNRYSVEDVKNSPNKLYIFGDNTQRQGKGGQAIIRGNRNARGIATKFLPSTSEDAYFNDKTFSENKSDIDSDIEDIQIYLENHPNTTVVFPKDGLGTGLAKLKEKAPQTYQYLKEQLLEKFGFNNDTGELTQEQPIIEETKEELPGLAILPELSDEFTVDEQKQIQLALYAKYKGSTYDRTLEQWVEYMKELVEKDKEAAIKLFKTCYL